MSDNPGKKPGDAASKLFESWAFPMTAAFWQSGEAYANALMDWQQEMAKFTNDRLNQNRELQLQLSRCKTMGDVAKLQQEWAMQAARAYIDEATRMVNIWSTVVQPGGPKKD